MHVYGAPAAPGGARGTYPGLVLLYAEGFGGLEPAYPFGDGDLVIGRDASCDIVLPQAAVSRQHARIRYENGGYVVADLGSRNGTLVDGAFVREAALEPDAELRVGDAIFKLVETEAEHYARYRIDGKVDGHVEPASRRIVGGYRIARLLGAAARVARGPVSIILHGESGTGKELFAREIHAASGRSGPFLAVNCAAIPPALVESELFGYRRGAFSGADRDKIGLVRAADRGTLLLDEIGDMPLEAQAKLLRLLQSKEIFPVGATAPEHVDVRIVCATHRDLGALREKGLFRGDLFARLNEYSLRIPPLRERKEDVHLLVRTLLARYDRAELGATFAYMTGLLHYDFPFNVRELEAAIKRGITLCDGPALDAPHLPDEIRDVMRAYGRRERDARASTPAPPDLAATFPGHAPTSARRGAAPTEAELRALLTQHQGNLAAVGRELGKERMQVHRWLKRYGIDPGEYR
jgi:DNA-binding NtrC family response regulator